MAEPARMPEPSNRDLLAAMLDELRLIRRAIERQSQPANLHLAPDDAGRYERFFLQLEENFSGLSLTFESWEVEQAAESDHDLAEALAECGLKDAAAIGYAFRKMKDREIGPYVLRREDRGWMLERTDRT